MVDSPIYPASPDDLEAVVALLRGAGLCQEDLTPEHMAEFMVLRVGDRLIGAVGLEVFDADALLRSLVVSRGHRGKGLGIQLVEAMESRARSCDVERLYLLTTTADRFFDQREYERIDRMDVPEAVAATTEFTSFCPDSAVCMRKVLG